MQPTLPNDPSLDPGDEVLIQKVLEGDANLFEVLINRHESKVRATLRRYVSSNEDLLDIQQQTWIKAWRNLSQFRGQSSFSTWVVRIAINEALQAYRLATRTKLVLSEDPDRFQHWNSRSRQQDFMLPFLVDKMQGLPNPYSNTLLLHTVYGMTDAEIAATERISLPAAKSRLGRARNLFRKQWQPLRKPSPTIAAEA